MRVFLAYLRSTGVSVPQLRQEQEISPLERAYAEHLERERGVCRNTRSSHMRVVRQFVQEHLGRKGARPSQLRVRDVTEFVLHHAYQRSHSKPVGMTIALRSFFAFLRQRGDITADLAMFTDLSIRQSQSKIAGRASPGIVGEFTKRARATHPMTL
jgi:site-specific recombinase XerD